MSFFSKLRFGSSEDPKFKDAKSQFEESKKALDKLGDHVIAYLAAENALLQAQKKLAEDMSSNLNNNDETNMVRQYMQLIDKILQEKQRLDDEMRREFLDPTNKYKAQYREIEDRIRERKRRMEEVEKLTDQVKKYREKADARLNLTERKLDSMTRAYEELNTELLSDIPKLVADKEKFFHPLVAILLDAQYRFHQTMAERLNELRAQVSNIDRKSVHSHPPCITPRQQSSANKTYSTLTADTTTSTTSVGAGVARPQPAPPPRAQPPVPPPRQVRARANWDFSSDDPQELPFRTGDILTIISQEGDWWTAELNGRRGTPPLFSDNLVGYKLTISTDTSIGLIPSNYVQLI